MNFCEALRAAKAGAEIQSPANSKWLRWSGERETLVFHSDDYGEVPAHVGLWEVMQDTWEVRKMFEYHIVTTAFFDTAGAMESFVARDGFADARNGKIEAKTKEGFIVAKQGAKKVICDSLELKATERLTVWLVGDEEGA